MITYKSLLYTRSEHLVTLLKFLLGANEIDYIVENEHIVYLNPERKMCIKVDEGELSRAKELVVNLPERLQNIEAA